MNARIFGGAGPLHNAAHLGSLAILWIHLAHVGERRCQFAFRTIDRQTAEPPGRG